ncbi:MAG: ABC transporter substrate-binding protein [Chloroflexi bacterium]|nr:ABC transporter substrate-binding protein [Chloroflexota bacterium]
MRKLTLLLTILLLASLALAACGAAAPAPAAQEAAPAAAPAAQEAAPAAAAPAAQEAAASSSGYSEAPMLAELVAAGKLPPVDERLPLEPFVVGPGVLMSETSLPDWEPGQYGGTLRSAHFRPDWNPDIFVMINEPLLSAPDLGVEGIRGNVLKDFEVLDNNTTFIFHMREGLKWSDGVPVTSEDVRFTYEDIYLNEKLTPSFPRRFQTGYSAAGQPMSLEVIDDFTFKIIFPEPYGAFLRNLVIEGWNGYTELIRPAHYLKQFHIDYVPLESLKDELTAMNLTDEWWQVFAAKDCQSWHVNQPKCADSPRLGPWLLVPSSEPGLLTFERNPYYHKVDTLGQQLPYIDKLISVLTEDVEMLNVNIFAGNVDFMRESTGLVKVPLYKENEAKGGFTTVLLDMHVDSSNLFINQTFDDPVWREVVRDIRFRQAVSLAMDRQEMIETLYYGFASLPEVSVGPDLYTRDLDRANALLDEMGLDKRDSEGYRLGPDGNRFEFLIESGGHAVDLSPAAELIGEYLAEVGIYAPVKLIDSTLYGQRQNANELKASTHWSHDQNSDDDHTSRTMDRGNRLWQNYMSSKGADGEEPPAWVLEAYDIDAERWGIVPGTPEYRALREKGFQWHRDNLPMLTIVEGVKYPLIISARMGNVASAGYAIAQNFSGEQFFYRE